MSKIFFLFLLIISSICQENNITNETIPDDLPFESDDSFDKLFLPNILHLDDYNYTEVLKKYDEAYVLIYAAWCSHCHELIPIYNETANYFKENKINVTFFKIDGSQSENASADFGVMAFPRIYFVNKGKRYKFDYQRTKKGLIYFRERKLIEDVNIIQKLDELKKIKNAFDTNLILLSTIKNKTSKIYKSFLDLAERALFIDFASCLSDECLQKYGEDIILFKPFDEKENSYKKDFGKIEEANYNSVTDFASIYGVETGVFAKQHDINLWLEFDKKAIFYFRESDKEEYTKFDAFFKEMGFKLRQNNTYVFVVSPNGNEIQTRIYKDLLILPEELPCIVYYDPNSGDTVTKTKVFKINHADMKKVNEKYIMKFVKKIKKGKMRRDLYSEFPLKEPKYIRGMKYVIGRDFDKEITDVSDRNVLLYINQDFDNPFENQFNDVMGNITEKYKDSNLNIKFTILNYRLNEPRDIEITDWIFPKAYLYTNAMKEKKIIKFNHKNDSWVTFEEFENFLIEKLNPEGEKKEEKEEKENQEKKSEEKKVEEKKDEDL
jgi:thiol-disulfide isomerase/thioredoxin